jgi:hypothetical protein
MKDDLTDFVQEELGTIASPFLLRRALTLIDQSSSDKKSLLEASEKVSRIIALFIDARLSERVFDNLKMKIEKSNEELFKESHFDGASDSLKDNPSSAGSKRGSRH